MIIPTAFLLYLEFKNNIGNSCKLYKDFESGNKRLEHEELFGIATNIIHIESGINRFNEISTNNSYYDDRISKYDKWKKDLSFIKANNYKPQNCNLFCPHSGICNHGTNILSTVKPKMERISNYNPIFHSREEVENDVKQAIFNAFSDSSNMVNIVKAQTSSGKTTSYLKLMEENPFDRFLIAVPTNILKNEVYRKASKLGINVMKTPSLEVIKDEIPPKIWKRISILYKTGQYHLVHPYINKIAKEKDIPCLREYLKEREKIKTFKGSVITTHRYFLNMDEQRLSDYDAVIIDEDIIFKSIIPNQGEITVSNLKKLLKSATDMQLARKIKKLLIHAKSETTNTIELPSFEWKDDDEFEFEDMPTPIDISSFCMAKYFYCRKADKENNLEEDAIVFLKPVTFKNAKYIIVSATVDEKIYRNYFGDENVDFYECKKARYMGSLDQYYNKSMSRSYLDSHPGIIRKLMEKSGAIEEQVITFMKYGIGNFHFGNTEGCNILEGNDILVIGTPHHAEFLYKLFAFSIGLDFDEDATMKKNRVVTRNGYRFPFTTYDDKALRDIHLWMIESELEQAVGRSRLLRYDCNVLLFSNFPLCQANLMKYESEKTIG